MDHSNANKLGENWNAEATREFYLRYFHLVKSAMSDQQPVRFLADNAPGVPYQPADKIISCAAHIGQLKLLLSEIDALNRWVKPATKLYCVYAGSAPGNKIGFLSEMFPTVTFILVDPRPHYVMFGKQDQYSTTHKDDFLYLAHADDPRAAGQTINVWRDGAVRTQIREGTWRGGDLHVASIVALSGAKFVIIEDYFDSTLATQLSVLPNLCFISDIRTKGETSDFPSSFHILFNSALHLTWLEILKCPAMTKFRCPYEITTATIEEVRRECEIADQATMKVFEECTVDYLDLFFQGKFVHLDGEIHLQAFAPPSTTETRLFTANLSLAEYDCTRYEQAMFYINRIGIYHGGYKIAAGEQVLANTMGLCLCRSCSLALAIINDYVVTHTTGGSPVLLLSDALSSMRRTLKVAGHGCYKEPIKTQADLFCMLGNTAVVRNKRAVIKPKPTVVKSVAQLSFDDLLDSLV